MSVSAAACLERNPEPRIIGLIIAIEARWERCLCCWAMPIDMKQPNRTQAWFWRLACLDERGV